MDENFQKKSHMAAIGLTIGCASDVLELFSDQCLHSDNISTTTAASGAGLLLLLYRTLHVQYCTYIPKIKKYFDQRGRHRQDHALLQVANASFGFPISFSKPASLLYFRSGPFAPHSTE